MITKIYVSSVIKAPIDKVWAEIRDFNALSKWHPFVESSRIEDDLPSASVGCVRNFELKDGGGTIRERLLALCDVERLCTYSILDAPMPVQNYVATVRLREITDANQTFGQWVAEFDVPPGEEQETVSLITSVFREGFNSLNSRLAG